VCSPAPPVISGTRSRSVRTDGPAETHALASALAAVAQRGDRLSLIGSLGAGKTQFAKGFAAGLGVTDVVNSPSFTLMAEYAGRLPLFHQDLYRLAGMDDALSGGLFDARQDAGVTLSEWAERLDPRLDAERLIVDFEVLGDRDRLIVLRAPASGRHDAYLAAATAWEARGPRRP